MRCLTIKCFNCAGSEVNLSGRSVGLLVVRLGLLIFNYYINFILLFHLYILVKLI